jgi:hypothetical protein
LGGAAQLLSLGGTTRMKKSTLILTVINLVGMIVIFLFCVSTANFAKMEQRDYYDFGDSLSMILIALPVLLVCFIVNAFWGIKALIGIFRRRDYRGSAPFAVVVAAWALLYLICMFVTKLPPNNSPEPPPIAFSVPHSRLTVLAARLSFCR